MTRKTLPMSLMPAPVEQTIETLPAQRLPGRATRRSPGARRASAAGVQAPARAVVVHSGARDSYQVARALEEAGLLERLVTDLYWPAQAPWARRVAGLLPGAVRAMLQQRHEPHLPAARVRTLVARGLLVLLLDRMRQAPFAWRRRATRRADAALGVCAGRLARATQAVLVTYSYYAYHALSAYSGPALLFQLHPHPASMRRILRRELAAHPDCAESLGKEWELALPEQDYARLVEETRMTTRLLAASSFTRATLVENGIPESAITVVPYGVDSTHFSPGERTPAAGEPLQLLFVGRINQRKGIKYLLEALRRFTSAEVQLEVCGRVVDDLALFAPFAGQVTVRPSVTADELLAAYRAADLFVFPSLGEGFGQVLLEALACGLPILSTTSTAAPDLIEDGVQGFIVAPRDAAALGDRIAWALTHRSELRAMAAAARVRAEAFPWDRFRAGVAMAVGELLLQPEAGRHV
ncbi:MAG TPA: glycosyltransferase family 4 protein [Acidobacteriaceae bacterium]